MAFKSPQAQELIKHVRRKYGRDLEFLWARLPECAIWRRGDNEKWFGIIMSVPRSKIIPGAATDMIEILDIRCAPDVIDFVVDRNQIFPGWHMNKRHWITIPLDGRMTVAQIQNLLAASFDIAGKK